MVAEDSLVEEDSPIFECNRILIVHLNDNVLGAVSKGNILARSSFCLFS